MQVIVEDGTGLELANSYCSVLDFKNYFKDRVVEIDYDSKLLLAAVVSGSNYVDLRWGRYLKGKPLAANQALEFPRIGLFTRYGKLIDGVPNDIKNAAILYAQEWLKSNLYPVQLSASTGNIKRKKTVVGPIETEVEYSENSTVASNSTYSPFKLPDDLCKKYINRSSNVIRN